MQVEQNRYVTDFNIFTIPFTQGTSDFQFVKSVSTCSHWEL